MPIPAEIQGPGDAVGALFRYLARTPQAYFKVRHLNDDLQSLRSIFSDGDYTAALVAFLKELPRALRDPAHYGGALEDSLQGVRRHKFCLEDQRDAILRLLEYPYRDGMHIIALRHRHDPPGMYGIAAARFADLLRTA